MALWPQCTWAKELGDISSYLLLVLRPFAPSSDALVTSSLLFLIATCC